MGQIAIFLTAMFVFVFTSYQYFQTSEIKQLNQSSEAELDVDEVLGILRNQKTYQASEVKNVEEFVRSHLDAMPTERSGEFASQFLKKVDLFDSGKGMVVEPGLFDFWEKNKRGFFQGVLFSQIMTKNIGVVLTDEKELIGVTRVQYNGRPVAVVQCSICHFGRVNGMVIPGLGNKKFDGFMYSDFVKRFRIIQKGIFKNYRKKDPEIAEIAEYYRKRISDPKVTNTTQGLIPVGIVRASFYPDPQKLPDGISRSQAKVPHLWGYAPKRKIGSFHDGFGDAEGGWAAGVSIVGRQTPEIVKQPYYVEKTHLIESVFEYLPVPKYPEPLNEKKVATGKVLYDGVCLRCHGDHTNGIPNTPPKFISLRGLETDSDLFEGTTEDFAKYVNEGPFAGFLKFAKDFDRDRPGYLAPHLNGIWARFPYLHNGSVPTIMDLLKVPKNRPKYFSTADIEEEKGFDSELLGVKHVARDDVDEEHMRRRHASGARDIYATTEYGQRNTGHDYGTYLSKPEKEALIEYLKSL